MSRIIDHLWKSYGQHKLSLCLSVATKCEVVPGKDAKEFRYDSNGVVIKKSLYGKNEPGGFEIKHIKKPSAGGSNDILNVKLVAYKNKK